MPDFLSDPPRTVLLALGVAAVVAGAVWFGRRTRRTLAVFLGLAATVVVLVLLDRLFDSPREEAVGAVEAMVRAANARDATAFASHIADTFEYFGDTAQPRTVTRDQVRTAGFWHLIGQHDVRVAAWDFAREDVTEPAPGAVEIGFLAKGEAGGKPFPMYFRARLARHPDGKFRLTALSSYDAFGRQNKRQGIPSFP
ncbi:MAG: hypothetical protein C0501_24090 [Isosphaera sp.]|nr:hypothetical protein [Isosphaera sp.]